MDSSPDSGIGRDGSRDGRRLEMDRLRRECTALRQERDEIAKEARKDRQIFEKRLQEAYNRIVNLVFFNSSTYTLFFTGITS